MQLVLPAPFHSSSSLSSSGNLYYLNLSIIIYIFQIGFVNACKVVGTPMNEHKLVFLGAGSAGMGVADTIVKVMETSAGNDQIISTRMMTMMKQLLLWINLFLIQSHIGLLLLSSHLRNG